MSFVRRPIGEVVIVSALLVALAAVFATNLHTATSYDEGVYLASLDALRRGNTLGSEVFASQPPGFYVILRVAGIFGGHSVVGIRCGFVVFALIGCAGAYALGRALAGVAGGLLAAGLVAILPPYAEEAVRITADLPAAGFTIVALALEAWAVRLDSPWLALASGIVLAFAVSVKLDALIACLPLIVLFLIRRSPRRIWLATAGGAAAVTAVYLVAYAGVLGDLWRSDVTFHRQARIYPSDSPNGHMLGHYLDFTTPSAWLVAMGVSAAIVTSHRRESVWLWVWAVAVALFLLWQRPLFGQHLVLLSAALGTAVGVTLGRLPITATALVILGLVIGLGQQYHQIKLAVVEMPAQLKWAAERIQSCRDPVGSDEPVVVFRARASTPGQLVDTSKVRFATRSLTPESVLELIDSSHVGAVYADRAFAENPEILRGLERRFGAPHRYGTARLYTSSRCPL